MIRLEIISIIVLLLLFPSLVPAQSESSGDEGDTVVGASGDYPSELPEGSNLTIDANRDELGNAQKLPKQDFTKDLRITSQRQNETRPNYFVLDGYVDMSYKDFRLQADHAEYDTATKDLVATGNVVLDQTTQRIVCERLELNLDTKKGVAYDVFGYVPPQIFFWGTKMEKLGEDEYKLYHGVFTECSQIKPHWSLKTNAATMTVNDYIKFNSFLLKAKKVPIFYSPFMMWPIKRDRATGFLFPGFGPNSRKGFYIGNSFFWAMNRSMDSTYWLDHYQLRGWGTGAEYRYAESDTSNGTVKAYFANDTQLGKQWTLSGAVKQDLPSDYHLAAIIDTFSSFQYIADTAQTVARASSQTKTVQAFVSKNWSYYSLNFLGNQSERLAGGNGDENSNTSMYYHYPEVEFISRNQQLFKSPFFWTLQSSYDLLGRGNRFEGETFRNTFQRTDLFPSISYPITYLSWMTFTPTFAYRWTDWTKQIIRDDNLPAVVGQNLLRNYMDLTFDIRGPNFSKIFDTPNMGYSQKWKHAIEPQITFHYRENIPERINIIVVDSDVDSIFGEKEITYSLTNILYAKRPIKPEKDYEDYEYQYYNPKPLEPEAETAWEFLSWTLQQTYNYDSDSFDLTRFPDAERFSDMNSIVRFNPSVNYSIQWRLNYNVKATQVTSQSVSATLKGGDVWYTTANYTYSNPVPDTVVLPGQRRPVKGNAFQVFSGVGLWDNRIALKGNLSYDITAKNLLSSGFGLDYNADCFTIGFNYSQFSKVYRTDGKERAFTINISLPNIGNFVSFQGGSPPRKF
jgi:LPS-assembly protein